MPHTSTLHEAKGEGKSEKKCGKKNNIWLALQRCEQEKTTTPAGGALRAFRVRCVGDWSVFFRGELLFTYPLNRCSFTRWFRSASHICSVRCLRGEEEKKKVGRGGRDGFSDIFPLFFAIEWPRDDTTHKNSGGRASRVEGV
jgi:hypothetical protein